MRLGGEIATFCTGVGISLAIASTLGMDALHNAEAVGHARTCISVPNAPSCRDVAGNPQAALNDATTNEYFDMGATAAGIALGILVSCAAIGSLIERKAKEER